MISTIISYVLNFLSRLSGKIVTDKIAELGYKSALETAKFLAWKTVIITLYFSGSLVAVSLILEFVFSEIYGFINQQISDISLNDSINFNLSATGFFAYLVDIIRIDDALRIIISASVTRFILKLTPFVRF